MQAGKEFSLHYQTGKQPRHPVDRLGCNVFILVQLRGAQCRYLFNMGFGSLIHQNWNKILRRHPLKKVGNKRGALDVCYNERPICFPQTLNPQIRGGPWGPSNGAGTR